MNPSAPRNNGHFESCIIHKQGMVRLNLLFRGCYDQTPEVQKLKIYLIFNYNIASKFV